MNIHRNNREWDITAIEMGYGNIRELLLDTYIAKRFTTKQLGEMLGIGKDRAAQLLRRHGIELRGRGGAGR